MKTKLKGKRNDVISSVKSKKELTINSLAIFYISLYFQNPKSEMAKAWIKKSGLSHKEAKQIYTKIMSRK